ncbi:uncharacterized protein LOC123427917 [Hordeum vulgare subsp. vulgare]|uniref:uncharacterized protein LOC123427917 n=1 Tax=Hordeum vulgare subsp. vulgare TaxID=112509 RepID=UPI001D1A3C27|nr:uncharacterized protein LOC123427917 [Hordeum vulgare subsp. vulgare]
MIAKLLEMVVRHGDAGDRVRKSLCVERWRPRHRYVSPATPPAVRPCHAPHARAVQAETNPSWSLRLGVVHSSSLVELYIRIYGQLAYVRSCGNFSCQYIWFPCIFQGNK